MEKTICGPHKPVGWSSSDTLALTRLTACSEITFVLLFVLQGDQATNT